MSSRRTQQFNEVGALHLPGAVNPMLAELRRSLARQPDGVSGTRIANDPDLARLLSGGFAEIVSELACAAMFPVRATYFDKNDRNNWALGWHQDRTIAVAKRYELAGFGPWTIKQGILHVQPPFDVVAAMRTIRIHLDPVPADNAPLLIASGSHRLGPIAAWQASELAGKADVVSCLAEEGDVWLYHTPILHASNRNAPGKRRRVLQVDYACDRLPLPLQWLGI